MTNEELAVLIQSGERDKLLDLWEQVQRLVWKHARRWAAYCGGGATVEDLSQAGFIALLRAVEQYDQTRAKFSTHFMFYLLSEFSIATGQYTVRNRKDPLQTAASLDAPLSAIEGEAYCLWDVTPDPAAEAALLDVEDRDWEERLQAAMEIALDGLSEGERRVLRARYYQGRSVDEIAQNEGVSKTAVYVKQQRALRRLREPGRARMLREYL